MVAHAVDSWQLRLAGVYVQPNGDILIDVIPWTISGTIRQQNLYALTFWLLVVGTLLCLVALRWSRLRVPAAATGSAAAAGWLLSNGPGEGAVLWQVRHGNALMLADTAVLPLLVLLLTLSWQDARRPC